MWITAATDPSPGSLFSVAVSTSPSIQQRTIITLTTLASRQLGRDFDLARSHEGLLAWDSADILPRDAWLRRTWQEYSWSDPANAPVLLTRWQELVLWEDAVAALERDVLLNASATAAVAAQAWQLLHSWQAPQAPDLSFDFSPFEASDDSEAFFAWMSRVRKKLRDRDWITSAELPGVLRARLASGEMPAPGAITLAGFDEFTAADRRLFDAVRAKELPSPVAASRVEKVACRDAADELTRAATWARRKLETQPNMRIGVAAPGLASLAAMAERIFDDVLHASFGFADAGGRKAFSISSSASLASTPMVSAALLALRLIEGVPREEAAMLWRSPFLRIDPEEGARLDVELRRHNVEDVRLSMHSLQRRFPALTAAARTLPARAKPSAWSAAFSRLLKLSGWPGVRPLTTIEHRTLESWKDLLSEFARLDVVLESISCGSAVSRLERMAMASASASNGEISPIQILDISESAGSHFDVLWIAGLHAGAWPPRAKPNPFLPLALQRMAGMPGSSADREFAAAKRVTERLFASAAEVVCSFPAHAADEEQQASPFLALLPSLTESLQGDTAAHHVFAQTPTLEPRPSEANLALPEGTVQRGGTSVIANQSACPFRAFAIHRLRAREMDEPDVGLSALDRGTLAHRVLEYLWKDLQTQARLLALSTEALEEVIRVCVNRALEKHVATQEPSPALAQFRQLEQGRLERLVGKWLDVEKTRPPFTVIQTEATSKVLLEGLILELRVDRIDQYDNGPDENGALAIIDYKTSKQLKKEMWLGERPEAPQLPLYAVTSDVPISEVAFAQLTTTSTKLVPMCGAELQEQLPRWDRVVRKLAADFLDGRAEVDPRAKPSPCDLCRLHALCRVRELRIPPHEEDRDE